MYDGCSPSPSSDPHHLPKSACNNTAWVHGYAPLAPRAYTPPLHSDLTFFFGYISNKSRKDLDDLMGEPPGFFYTCVRRLLTYWFNWLNTYEIGIILVIYEDVFIADLQCAMTRP
jgi:hypothetical protein